MNIAHFKNIFNRFFFTQKKYIIAIWILVTIVTAAKQLLIGQYNNYKIFKGVFYHTIHKLPLYQEYPTEYFDHNHYGPIFSLLIAPFALLPDYIGLILWALFNAIVLIWAITKLPLKPIQTTAILWICLHEFLTTLLGLQFNPIMTALIILSFVYIDREKVFWAAFFIILGVFVKLYGIVGLAFFFFTNNKLKFIASLFFWSVVLFALPMLLSSPQYIIQTYIEWYERLVVKNQENTSLFSMQDISLMGMVRRILQDSSISNLPFIITGVTLFGMQYLRISQYKEMGFRLLILASTLIFTVIFSTGSESPTYIIAFVGVAIWFVIQPKPITKYTIFLLVFALILTSLSPSDLIPKYLRDNFIQPYALKALPCILIWISILNEIYFKNFLVYNTFLKNDRK